MSKKRKVIEMSGKLPLNIDPIQLTSKGFELQGQLPLKGMPRLCELLFQPSGYADISLRFHKEGGIPLITGEIRLTVFLLCQRCIEPMEYPLVISVALSPILSESQSAKLPSTVEPLLIQENAISLSAMIEDEILLNVPMIPKHPEICPVKLPEELH